MTVDCSLVVRIVDLVLSADEAMRNAHSSVLLDDEPRMSSYEVGWLKNTLCCTHGVVTSTIWLSAHLHSAHDLARRDRNNWRAANFVKEGVSEE
uniref:Uncharacterized protein n=1 Tax=Parascaris univalens TaxID=6257 RepID=A0A915BYL8_PARUN